MRDMHQFYLNIDKNISCHLISQSNTTATYQLKILEIGQKNVIDEVVDQ